MTKNPRLLTDAQTNRAIADWNKQPVGSPIDAIAAAQDAATLAALAAEPALLSDEQIFEAHKGWPLSREAVISLRPLAQAAAAHATAVERAKELMERQALVRALEGIVSELKEQAGLRESTNAERVKARA